MSNRRAEAGSAVAAALHMDVKRAAAKAPRILQRMLVLGCDAGALHVVRLLREEIDCKTVLDGISRPEEMTRELLMPARRFERF